MFKASRYPPEVADEIKEINSYGASIDNDFASTLIGTSNDPTVIKMKDELAQARVNQGNVPSLSFNQRLTQQLQNVSTRRSYYDQFDETARNR